MKNIYTGWMRYDSNGEKDDLLALDGQFLAELIEDAIRVHGKYLSVRYFTSDKEQDIAELEENLVKVLYGAGDADYRMHYSEITGYLWTDEELNVGGHDLLAELKSRLGEYNYQSRKDNNRLYLYLEIDYAREPRPKA